MAAPCRQWVLVRSVIDHQGRRGVTDQVPTYDPAVVEHVTQAGIYVVEMKQQITHRLRRLYTLDHRSTPTTCSHTVH